MNKPWAVTPRKIQAAVERVVRVSHPRQVILFGSSARGTRAPHDVDLLVVSQGEVASRRRESVRIRRALRGITMPIDVLVISARQLHKLADQPGLVYREAIQEGKVVYDAAK